jgi:hypothetical protein
MASPANYNAAGQIAITGGTNPALDESKTNTTITRDPFQEFLFNLLGQQAQNSDAYVPDYTKTALQNFTQNPAGSAAQFFPALAAPLMSALRPTEDRETAQLENMFRSAGGTGDTPMQSGAFANEARLLIGDQAQRREQTLANTYIPLTNQISQNTTNAINSGLQFPQANTNVLRSLAPLAGSINPLSTQVEGIKGSSNATPASSGYATGTQQQQQAAGGYVPTQAFLDRSPTLTQNGYQYPTYDQKGNITGYTTY